MSLACVLVINCGSSSMKLFVTPQDAGQPLPPGLAERLGIDHVIITSEDRDGHKSTVVLDDADHQHTLKVLFAKLNERQLLEAINAVGHRVVHGDSDFKGSVLVTDDVIEKVRALSMLAPLRSPANLVDIGVAWTLLPALPHIAVFGTALHQTLSPAAYTYAISLEFQQDYMVRCYGSHGTSHRYIAVEALASLDLDPAGHGIVVAHLSNGSSLYTVQNGAGIDASMGMTPSEGLIMGTCYGDLGFGAVTYPAERTGQTFGTLYEMLNSQSDLVGISGLSSGCRTPQQACDEGHERAMLAISVLVYRLAQHIGGYVASLKRFDALIFTSGIGESSALAQGLTVQRLQTLGLELDKEHSRQLSGGYSGLISKADTTKIAVIPTNEKKITAIDAAEIVRTV